MLKTLYFKYLGNRVFYKLLLMYSAIIIATISLLIFIIVYNITSILREQAMNYNKQVLQTVNTYFYNQNKNFKKIMSNIYVADWGKETLVIQHIENLIHQSGASMDSSNFNEHVESTRVLNDFLSNYALAYDNDISDAIIIPPSFDYYINASRGVREIAISDYFSELHSQISNIRMPNINAQKTYFIPPFKVSQKPGAAKIYAICDYLRDVNDNSKYVGYLVATYNPAFIRNSYRQFSKYLIGDILIVTNDGRVIYDSSEKNYYQPFRYLNEISKPSVDSYQDGKYIINVARNTEFGFMVVSMVSKAELYQKVNVLNRLIIATAVISILLILILTFLSTRTFSKRVNNIIGTMGKIQKGNLSARAAVSKSNDEIGQISDNLNLMTEKLDEYIKKEYVSEIRRANAELKQKAAELYALQSQINPHFLYNTLEAIRMRALSSGDKKVGEMIKILAKLFRSSIKDEMVISVKDEINYCKTYLELYNIRFGDKLSVIYSIEPEILEYGIIKHLLQPIIENSIVHGVNFNRDHNVITIQGGIADNSIVITVSDNGKGMDEKTLNTLAQDLETPRSSYSDHIGVFNVDSRIKLIYGNEYGLEIRSAPDIGTEVTLRIAATTREELIKNVQSVNR